MSDEQVPATPAELLRTARELAGLSQTEVGQRAGVPRTMVSAYERDLRQPTVATLRRLLGAAGFDLSLRLVRHSDPDEVVRAMEQQFTGGIQSTQQAAEQAEPGQSIQARARRAAAERARQNKRHGHGSG